LTPIEALQQVQSAFLKELDTRARAIEERRRWYENKAFELIHEPTKVLFVQPYDEFSGSPVFGLAERIAGRCVISIKPCLPLEDERFTFVHEVSHFLLGHVKEITRSECEQGKITRAVLLDGALDKVTGINTGKMYQDVYAKRENDADRLGLELYKLLWQD
jgi:hypothetical protein